MNYKITKAFDHTLSMIEKVTFQWLFQNNESFINNYVDAAGYVLVIMCLIKTFKIG